jgi:hypothetical protein
MNKDIAKIVLEYLTYDDLKNINFEFDYKLDFIENNIDKLDDICWYNLSSQNLPISFFNKHLKDLYWRQILTNKSISKQFLKQHIRKYIYDIPWTDIVLIEHIPLCIVKEYIKEYIYTEPLDVICRIFSNPQVPISLVKFIQELYISRITNLMNEYKNFYPRIQEIERKPIRDRSFTAANRRFYNENENLAQDENSNYMETYYDDDDDENVSLSHDYNESDDDSDFDSIDENTSDYWYKLSKNRKFIKSLKFKEKCPYLLKIMVG